MSAESREKAEQNGMKSGKGLELVSRTIRKLTGGREDAED